MPRPLALGPSVTVPAQGWGWKAVRSSGPGGQNVNKVASRVELRVDLGRIEGLSTPARERLLRLTANRRDAEGRLLVTSQRTRDQSRNLEDAIQKTCALVAQALVAPRPRRPTRASKGSVERRLSGKKREGARKRQRGRVGPDSE
jgi:ribosome-associated protein